MKLVGQRLDRRLLQLGVCRLNNEIEGREQAAFDEKEAANIVSIESGQECRRRQFGNGKRQADVGVVRAYGN